MELKSEIGYEQVLELARLLPPVEQSRLKEALNKPLDIPLRTEKEKEEFRKLILNGPTLAKKNLGKLRKQGKG